MPFYSVERNYLPIHKDEVSCVHRCSEMVDGWYDIVIPESGRVVMEVAGRTLDITLASDCSLKGRFEYVGVLDLGVLYSCGVTSLGVTVDSSTVYKPILLAHPPDGYITAIEWHSEEPKISRLEIIDPSGFH